MSDWLEGHVDVQQSQREADEIEAGLRAGPRTTFARHLYDHAGHDLWIALLRIRVGYIYLPQPGLKFDYKLAWFERFIKHASRIKRVKVPEILARDLNVVPTEFER